MRTVARSGWPELAHKLAPRPYVQPLSAARTRTTATMFTLNAKSLMRAPLLPSSAVRHCSCQRPYETLHQRKKIPGSRRFFLRDRESQRSLLGSGTPPHLRRISWLSLHTSQIGWLTAYNSTRAEAPTEPSAQIALPGKREDLRLGRGVIV